MWCDVRIPYSLFPLIVFLSRVECLGTFPESTGVKCETLKSECTTISCRLIVLIFVGWVVCDNHLDVIRRLPKS